MKKICVVPVIFGLVAMSASAEPFVESGLMASGMDVTRLVRTSVDNRMMENVTVERHDGGSIWLDLTGTTSEADHVGKTAGYKNDVWAMNLGADIKKGDSFFGVVYSYAYSEGESRNLAQKEESEGDFFSVQVFGQQRFGNLALSANGGIMHSHGEGRNAQASTIVHSNILTADLGAKYVFEFAPVTVVPYVKAETTYLDTTKDGATSLGSALIHQFPVGVNVSHTYEIGSWKVRPVLDAAIVKTTGDTEVGYNYQGTHNKVEWISDSTLYRGQIGITAYGEKARFGLNYEYLGADQGREAHTVDVQAQYIF